MEIVLIQLAQFGLSLVAASVSNLVSNSDVVIQQTRFGDLIDSIGKFGSDVVVASVSFLVSDSDVAIQQTRIGDRTDSISTVWIGCCSCFRFYFGFQFGRCHPAKPVL